MIDACFNVLYKPIRAKGGQGKGQKGKKQKKREQAEAAPAKAKESAIVPDLGALCIWTQAADTQGLLYIEAWLRDFSWLAEANAICWVAGCNSSKPHDRRGDDVGKLAGFEMV